MVVPNIALPEAFTLSFYMKPVMSGNSYMYALSIGSISKSNSMNIYLTGKADSSLGPCTLRVVGLSPDDTAVIYMQSKNTAANGFCDGNWHHVLVSAGGTGLSVYIDGGIVATSQHVFIRRPLLQQDLYIGSRSDLSSTRKYHGYIAHVNFVSGRPRRRKHSPHVGLIIANTGRGMLSLR